MKLKPFYIHVETEEEIWEKYLRIINPLLPHKRQLSEEEIKCCAYILVTNIDKDLFTGIQKDKMMKHLGKSSQSVAQLKHNLKAKGWIEDDLLWSPVRQLKKSIIETKEPFKGIDVNLVVKFNDIHEYAS